MNRFLFLSASVFLLLTSVPAQDYLWPTDAGQNLSSNFGEFRDNHFHMGLDIKTGEKEGFPVYAVTDGYISRMVANFTGYGKALYLNTNDGKTIVYAHLSWFSPLLEAVLRNMQTKKNRYVINEYFSENDFPVAKGDLIGYTGNTGSSYGPHLHFEIRNEKEQPLNPLTNGFPLDDRIPPTLQDIAIIPLSTDTYINGGRLFQTFPLLRDKTGAFSFPDTLNCSGKIGIAVKAHDRRQGANNHYQLHRLELWVKDKLFYALHFDTLDYSETRNVHSVRDYGLNRLNLGEYTKLYRPSQYGPVSIGNAEQHGILNVTPGYHKIEIRAIDASGNVSVAQGTIFGNPPFDMMIREQKTDKETIQFDLQPSKIVIPIEEVSVYSFTGFGYADRKIDIIEETNVDQGLTFKIPQKQVERRSLQFIGINRLGAYSKPVHWTPDYLYANPAKITLDLKLSQTEAGVFVQLTTEQIIPESPDLYLDREIDSMPISIEKSHPNVYLTKALDPSFFQGIKGMNAVLKGNSDREIRFNIRPQLVSPGEPVTVLSVDRLCSVRSKKKSVYSPTAMWIDAVKESAPVKGGTLLSKVYQLQPFEIPLKDSIYVGIRFGEKVLNSENTNLYYYDKQDGWTIISSDISRQRKVITGSVFSLEAIAIIQDMVPPEIVESFPGNHGKYKAESVSKISVIAKDKLSDIDANEKTIGMTLNASPVRFAYQPVKKEVSFSLDEPLEIGKHSYSVWVHDKAGNRTERTVNFTIN